VQRVGGTTHYESPGSEEKQERERERERDLKKKREEEVPMIDDQPARIDDRRSTADV
jgi:hypothetical protein